MTNYSVPHGLIGKKVEVRATGKTVEIFYDHDRIASHKRLYGRSGQYSTVTEHMPLYVGHWGRFLCNRPQCNINGVKRMVLCNRPHFI